MSLSCLLRRKGFECVCGLCVATQKRCLLNDDEVCNWNRVEFHFILFKRTFASAEAKLLLLLLLSFGTNVNVCASCRFLCTSLLPISNTSAYVCGCVFVGSRFYFSLRMCRFFIGLSFLIKPANVFNVFAFMDLIPFVNQPFIRSRRNNYNVFLPCAF